MNNSNMPPGVSANDIPGNGPDDMREELARDIVETVAFGLKVPIDPQDKLYWEIVWQVDNLLQEQ